MAVTGDLTAVRVPEKQRSSKILARKRWGVSLTKMSDVQPWSRAISAMRCASPRVLSGDGLKQITVVAPRSLRQSCGRSGRYEITKVSAAPARIRPIAVPSRTPVPSSKNTTASAWVTGPVEGKTNTAAEMATTKASASGRTIRQRKARNRTGEAYRRLSQMPDCCGYSAWSRGVLVASANRTPMIERSRPVTAT